MSRTLVMATCPSCGAKREVWDSTPDQRCRRCYHDSRRVSAEHRAAKKRANGRKRYWLDPDKHRDEASLDFVLNQEARLAAQRERRQREPEKWQARALVARAVQAGYLSKESCPCGEAKVEAHHDNYDEPLQVRWLCSRCHGLEHRKD